MDSEGLCGVWFACRASGAPIGCGMSAVSVFPMDVGVEFASWPGRFGNDGSSITMPTGETTPSSLHLGQGSAMVMWNGAVGRAVWV